MSGVVVVQKLLISEIGCKKRQGSVGNIWLPRLSTEDVHESWNWKGLTEQNLD